MLLTPSDRAVNALLRWPSDRPLVALVSGEGGGNWTNRSILAEPQETRLVRLPRGIEDGRRAIEREVRTALRRSRATPSPNAGWIVALSYDLGRVFEKKARAAKSASDDRDWPIAALCWCPDVLVLDHASGEWSIDGDPARVPLAPRDADDAIARDDASFRAGSLRSDVTRALFESAVERCVGLIHAGDLFQANVARRVSADFSGSTRSLAAQALRASSAWFGAYIECDPGRTIVSMSPELFLSLDARSRRVVTRPIKGTRPAQSDVRTLRDSAKDQAELTMIVDLMRNDLGRVCALGSVHVDSPRTIETHANVHHGVADVSGTLRSDVDVIDLLAATFPPGSVTGAPKVRAMQVIDELEPVRRGAYCGATGLIASDGSLALNVAIRTISLSGRGDPRTPGELDGVLDYWAGCGIVADSNPTEEWDESVAKSEVLLRALTPQRDQPPRRPHGRTDRGPAAEAPAAS